MIVTRSGRKASKFAEAGVGPKGHVSHRARAMADLAPRLLAYLRSL